MKNPQSKKLIYIMVAVIALILAVTPAVYFYNQYQKAQALLKDPNQIAKKEVLGVTTQIGKIMELPTGEEPTVATVTDKSKLTEQPFFNKAEVGDKVLIYMQEKKAILYRPSKNKIIEVGPVTITQNATPSASPKNDVNQNE